jgi:hypothetical protein
VSYSGSSYGNPVAVIGGGGGGYGYGAVAAPTTSTPVSCGQLFYTATVFESTPAGSQVLRLNGTGSAGCSLRWSIVDNPLGRFTIDPASGVISVAGALIRRYVRSAMEIRVRGTDCVGSVSIVNISILSIKRTMEFYFFEYFFEYLFIYYFFLFIN